MTPRSACHLKRWWGRVTLLIAAIALVPPVAGASERIASGQVAVGPALAGDAVVWTEASGGVVRVLRAELGGGVTTLHTGPGEARSRGVGPASQAGSGNQIVGSPSHVVFNYGAQDGSGGTYAVGPDGMQRADSPSCGFSALDLDGSLLAAYEACRNELVLADLSSGSRADVGRKGSWIQVKLAGRYLAWATYNPLFGQRRHEVVVYDREANRDVYRVDMEELLPGDHPYGFDYKFDLQADGKLAVGYGPSGAFSGPPPKLAWFSPSEPRPHVIQEGLAWFQPAMAADLIAVARKTAGGREWPWGVDYAVLNLRGEVVRLFDTDGCNCFLGDIAFDGRRMAWVTGDNGLQTTTLADHDPPKVLRFDIRPRRFAVPSRGSRASQRRGVATVSATLKEPAFTTVAITRVHSGGRRAHIGRVRLRRAYGPMRAPFSGRVKGRPLRPGRYTARLLARDRSDNPARTSAIRFVVLSR